MVGHHQERVQGHVQLQCMVQSQVLGDTQRTFKWVFKIKRDATFCIQLVACQYSRIPRADFNKNYVPVMNNVTWWILLVAIIVWGLDAIIVDVETAFLHGDPEEEIYINLI